MAWCRNCSRLSYGWFLYCDCFRQATEWPFNTMFIYFCDSFKYNFLGGSVRLGIWKKKNNKWEHNYQHAAPESEDYQGYYNIASAFSTTHTTFLSFECSECGLRNESRLQCRAYAKTPQLLRKKNESDMSTQSSNL